MAAAAASTSSGLRCFNSNCKEAMERPRKGWRRRTGDFADLCDRCSSAYEEGKFCETFHLNASGWRCCESCGKQIHCGCIVSFHMFVLLDAGGIECITCARKSFILTPNPAWPPPSLILPLQPERIKDISVKNWSPIAGSGPVPWRQAPSLFNGSGLQSELQSRTSFEFDVSGGLDRLRFNERLSFSSMEKRKQEESFEKLMNGSLRIGASEMLENGSAGGANVQEKPSPCVNNSQPTFSMSSDFNLGMSCASENVMNDHKKASGAAMLQPAHSPLTEKRSCSQNQTDLSETHIRNGRPRGDARGRSQLLPRYWPQITDEELRQISGDSNSVLTPLFQKMLSASDAGRIGRLVLPKKCAEAYFPPISQPEGIPLKIKDLKGKEWVFQFRFWPNNNSRMYVLEGITPCIQSMQLQAGDYVTFGRLEPEGMLVMGSKKASTVPSDQGNDNCIPGCELSNGDVVGRNNKVSENNKSCEVLSSNSHAKGTAASRSFLSKRGESGSIWSGTDKPVNAGKEVHEIRPSVRGKRKNSTLGLKSKRLRIENEDSLELKVTWEQVQGLIRPPPDKEPNVFIIEDFEIEEYEDAPVIGRPTIPAEDHLSRKIQWVQCEDCFKWRKLPANALLPSRWTCSKNSGDPDRAVCSAVEELTTEKFEALLPSMATATSKKMKASKLDPDSVVALEGLDALANLAVQEKTGSLPASSPQNTTKHPRHKVGCSCIVCIQPPSGKGPKHKQPCDCVVCKSVKRRHKTLMMKREKKQSEKEAEPSQDLQPQLLGEQVLNIDGGGGSRSPKEEMRSDECFVDNPADADDDNKCCASSFKGQIDLNMQPDREEEHLASFFHGTSDAARLLLDGRERHHEEQQKLSPLGGGVDLVCNQGQQDDDCNGVVVDNNGCKRGADMSLDEQQPSSLNEVMPSSSPAAEDPNKQSSIV